MMKAAYKTSAVLTCLLVASPTYAGGWVSFGNETSPRLVAASSLGTSDTEEKDYAWGDVDQDGDIDLVVVRKEPYTTPGRRRNVLFMNEGTAEGHAVNGVLVDRTDDYAKAATDGGQGFLDLTNDRDVALVDVNGDGWLDIITAPACNGCPGQPKTITHPRVYINLGNDGVGSWLGFRYEERRIPTLPQPPNFCAVAAGDVTGDGAADLYFVDYQSGLEDRLLINNGSGFFTDESSARMTEAMLSSSFGTHAVIADMNGDGWKDIVKSENGPVEIFNNAGAGFFDILDETYDGAAYHVGVGDLNGDGRLDIVVTDDGFDPYLLNQGNGGDGMANFSAPISLPGTNGFGSNSVIVDLDNDGFNEVIIADVDVDIPGCSRVTEILRNDATNPLNVSFTADSAGIPANMLNGVHDVAVFDVNGDCWLDLVIGRCTGTQVWINQALISACPPVSPADFSGPLGPGFPDGCVDAFDLGTLLGAWCSAASDPDPPKDVDPPCEGCTSPNFALADISGAANVPDGCVDAFDLAKLLAEWCSAAGGNPCGTCS